MKICVTGGAGYVGSVLVPSLLGKGHDVTVLDTFWYGDYLPEHPNLIKIKGDIRSEADLKRAFDGQQAVIHLACISNDPSFDMNADMGKSVNYDCFKNILWALKDNSVPRFIYASSSSVYGVSDLGKVVEGTPERPLTDYSKFKLACEVELKTIGTNGCWTIVRPATVCGYSPRQRLDLVVNIFTIQALVNGRMTIHGGSQTRPNINILDMVAAYEHILDMPVGRVNEKTFNVGFQNLTLLEIADLVEKQTKASIVTENVIDQRSYRVDSKKIQDEVGFQPMHTVEEAIHSIEWAFRRGEYTDPMNNPAYYNIKKMKELGL